jgi:hypothetical protein
MKEGEESPRGQHTFAGVGVKPCPHV